MLYSLLDRVKDMISRSKHNTKEVGDKAYVIASTNSVEEQRALNALTAKQLAQKEKMLAKKERMLAEKEARLREMQKKRVATKKKMIRKLEYFDEYDIDEVDENDIDVFAVKRFMHDPFTGLIDDPFIPNRKRKRNKAIDLFDFE